MSYGLTATGFVPKTLQVIKAELESAFRSEFGAGINLEPSSVFGQIVGIFAEREALLWEMAEDIYNADRPDSATGASLDTLAALTGATRLAATKSTVTVTASGTPGTVLPVGRVISVDGSGARFVTLAEATLDAISGDADIECEAEEYGPVPAYASTLTVIETPVSGWDSVTNAADAEVGRDTETDEDFRVRRELLLREQGNAGVDAIRADVLAVDGVESCSVFENVGETTNSDGVPPHSIEVLVQGGDDADVAKAIFESKAAGIGTYGDDFVTHTDSQGDDHLVYFSRPTEKPVYIIVNGTKDADTYPSDGDTQVKAALVAAGDLLELGDDVVSSRLSAAVFGVSGVLDVSSLLIGFSNPPVSAATLAVGTRERATFDAGDIVVNLTAA